MPTSYQGPILSEGSLGPDGWRILHEDMRRSGRGAKAQALAWLRFAAKLRLEGRNVELTPAQLDRLLGRSDLEPVA